MMIKYAPWALWRAGHEGLLQGHGGGGGGGGGPSPTGEGPTGARKERGPAVATHTAGEAGAGRGAPSGGGPPGRGGRRRGGGGGRAETCPTWDGPMGTAQERGPAWSTELSVVLIQHFLF